MAVGCGANTAKIFLIIFNIIFWLSGAALLGIGIWLLVDNNILMVLNIFKAFEGSSELIKYAAYVLIAVGAFVLIVGFFGCCGAIKESRVMLGIYIVLLVLIMGLEIAAGVLAILYKDKIKDRLETELGVAFDKYYDANNDTGRAFTQGLNVFQVEFKCCGIKGPTDYSSASKNLDPTCCVLKDNLDPSVVNVTFSDAKDGTKCKSSIDSENKDYRHNTGCLVALEQWIDKHATILIGVGIGIACLELFGFIFAVCLCRNVGEED